MLGEGTVSGDVATIAGPVIHKQVSEMAGVIIIFGGVYRPETLTTKRGPEAESGVFGMFEEKFR